MLPLQPLKFEGLDAIPLCLDSGRRLHFCVEANMMIWGEFELIISADDDDWDFDDIWLGGERLSGGLFEWAALHFAEVYEEEITNHINEHLPAAKDQARADSRDFAMGCA